MKYLSEIYDSEDKIDDISIPLAHLHLTDYPKQIRDAPETLDRIIARIIALEKMVRPKGHDEEAKIWLLKEAIAGMEWGLRASINIVDR